MSGTFRANSEVDELRWVTPEAAAALLSYERDIAVVQFLAAALRPVGGSA